MDFYKKMIKVKDPNSVLSDKECKCASLQAITNEAIKENNKKSLRELVEEINSHLADLRAIKDDKELKNKVKCLELIKKFEDCLVKIVNTTSQDILEPIKAQLLVIQDLTNKAIAADNYDELKRLSERIERNIMIVNEIPEVKGARNSTNADEKVLALANKYTALLNEVLCHLAHKTHVSGEQIHNEIENIEQDKLSELKKVPPPGDSNKIGINEIEEKLKQMRQRRLNRLSTFVDEQSTLSKERQKENKPQDIANQRNSKEATTEQEKINKSIPIPDVVHPSLYKTPTQDNYETKEENKIVTIKKLEKAEISGRKPVVTSNTAIRSTINNTNTKLVKSQNKSLPQPNLLNRQTIFDDEKTPIRYKFSSTQKTDSSEPKKESTSIFRTSFGKGGLTRSFAERQIENARIQNEKDQPAKTANITPPRTPTQIRKIFSSFNCALGTNNKSAEDVRESYIPIDSEFKRVEPTKREVRSNNNMRNMERNQDLSPPKTQEVHVDVEKLPAVPDRTKKPAFLKTKASTDPPISQYSTDYKSGMEKPRIQPALPKVLGKFPQQSSTDNELVVVRHNESSATDHEPPEFITIKRNSSTTEQAANRCSFSTFRTSSESVQEDDSLAVGNPIYQMVNTQRPSTCSISRQNSVKVDNMLMAAAEKEPGDFKFNTLDFIIRKQSRKMSYRNDNANTSRIEALEPDIRKLEFIIKIYRGLKRDDDYMLLDKALTKYYLKVNEVRTETGYDSLEKQKLLTRLKKAHDDLNARVIKNEEILMSILTEQVTMIAENHEIPQRKRQLI